MEKDNITENAAENAPENTTENTAENTIDSTNDNKKEKKKMNKPLKITLIVLAVLLSLAIVLLGSAYAVFKHYYSMLDYEELFSSDEWETLPPEELERDEGEDLDSVDPSQIATPDEMKGYLEQIEQVEKPSSDFQIQYDKIGGSLGEIERNYTADYISAKDNVTNILLIGIDSRRNVTAGLSDVMMVVSICPDTKSIVLTSFLRDIYVAIPGHSPNRLNVAYALGGPSLLVETIEKNFGLRIDRYAMVNFYTFVDAVDSIGGVSIYLTDAELSVINSHIYYTNKIVNNVYDRTNEIENKGAGYYELNGVQALGYARIRKIGSDFARTNRQRNIVGAVINKAKGLSPSEWNSLLNKILPCIKTNLTESDLLSMLINAASYIKYDLKSISTPPPDNFKYMRIDGRSVIGVDLTQVRAHLKNNIYPE